MNTKDIGDLSEISVIKQCIKNGWEVLKPFGDNKQYDIVINRGKGYEKVQIKTIRHQPELGRMYAAITRKSYVDGEYVNVKYKKEEVDIFALYNPEFDKSYIFPYTESCGISLRLEATKNNQSKGVFFAKDFEI